MRSNAIINNLAQAIAILNREGEIVYATDYIKTILGYDSKELIGKSSFDLLCYNNIQKVKPHYKKIVARRNLVINSVLRMKHKEGSAIWAELTATNLLHDAQINGILVIAKNITGKRRIEEQKLATIITAVREEERHAIAEELHDNINQMIATSVLLIDSAMNNSLNREVMLSTSSKTLREAIDEIRKLSSSLASYDLVDFSLNRSVKKFVEKILLGKDLRIVVKINESIEPLLAEKQKLHLFRIAQEQIGNILKHARATKVVISLSKSDSCLQLKIKDNGAGFDVKQSRKGIGISNMIQRVKTMNGQFHIASESSRGTSVIIRLPL